MGLLPRKTLSSSTPVPSVGRRISKYVNDTDVTTIYVYNGDQVIAEYEEGALARKFIYGPGIDEPVCMMIPSGQTHAGTYFYYDDGLGSVIALVNSSETIVERYKYDAFGRVKIGNSDFSQTYSESQYGNPYLFTGRRWDSSTGLYYYRFRDYSPALGRFLQPAGYIDGMNLYAYCGNNPLNWLDPWGLKTILGIHTGVGHAWISVNEDGNISTYGLWHLSRSNGYEAMRLGGDLYKNRESKGGGTANRYYELNERQEKRLNKWLSKKHKYHMPLGISTHNCSSFASDTIREVVGEDVNADDPDAYGLETPAELGKSILELEKIDPTSDLAPKGAPKDSGCSSGSS